MTYVDTTVIIEGDNVCTHLRVHKMSHIVMSNRKGTTIEFKRIPTSNGETQWDAYMYEQHYSDFGNDIGMKRYLDHSIAKGVKIVLAF